MNIINNYYDRETNTVQLSIKKNFSLKTTNEKKDVKFFVTAVKEEDIEKIKKRNTENFIFNFSNIYSYGNGNKKRFRFSFVKDLIEVEKRNHINTITNKKIKKEFYRNYEKSKKEWLKNIPFINSCEDYIMSWQSVLRKLGAKKVKGLNNKYIPFYVVIWYKEI